MTPPSRKSMTSEHKAALAEGRAQGRAVRAYLDALESHKPKRGRKRTPESMRKRLGLIEADMGGADPMRRLQLVQERMDIEAALARTEETIDLTDLENAFVETASNYGSHKGITYSAWREVGVSAAILKRAGVSRGS